MYRRAAVVLALTVVTLPSLAGTASGQGIVVDHTSVALFEQIPEEYLAAAAALTMMFVDRSVGVNINDGLTCLSYPSDEAAPTSCKRYAHVVPAFSSSPSEVNWSRAGGYSRANWDYYGWPGGGIPPELPCGRGAGSWHEKLGCFIAYVDANPARYRVFSYQNSFLEADTGSDIASPVTGYFAAQADRFDIADLEALQSRHPEAVILHFTTSLARNNGSQVTTDFNDQMREYVRNRQTFLFDVADIESHDPAGNPCYDNRDGVPYTAGNAFENHADDGQSYPAICQHYTRESEGGHLGSPEVGKIRVAKAFWVVMARIAGWNPEGGSSNTPPEAAGQQVATPEDTPVAIVLTGSDADGDPLTFRVVRQPARGTLSGAGADLVYTPSANTYGPDDFAFVANDGRVDSAPQAVLLTVSPVNDDPVAAPDSATTDPETPVQVPVLANDADVDGDTLTIVAVGPASAGATSNDGSAVTYTPAAGFAGTDTFAYTVADGLGASATADVTVTVRSAGTPDAGFALRFDGVSDYVTLAAASSMMPGTWVTTKTVSLWVKPEGAASCVVPSPASCDAIVGDRPRYWGISRGTINGLDRIWIWNFDGTLRTVGVEYVPGEWVHVALVHGAGTLSAYRNGVLVGRVPSGATQQPTPGAPPVLHVGGIINSTSRNWTFTGELDELQIWETARAAEEILAGLRAPLTGGEAGLAAYYRMSDGVGTVLTDDSGRGWTGTLRDGGQGVPPDTPIAWVPSGAFASAP